MLQKYWAEHRGLREVFDIVNKYLTKNINLIC